MKVLVVGPDMSAPGGVANYYLHVYPLLARDGIETEYLAIGQVRAGGGIWHLAGDQLRFRRAVEAIRPDLVHINPSLNFKSVLRDGMFCLSASRSRCPLLVFFRGWDTGFERTITGLRHRLFMETFGRADAFIVLANRFRDTLRQWGVQAPVYSATTAVPQTLLETIDVRGRLEGLMERRSTRVLFLGRLERDKGVVESVKAVVRLAQDGLDISISVAGSGAAINELEAIEEANRHCVKLLGYVRGERKAEILASHDIFCFPSMYGEGMPNALLEAMACGMPVITYPAGGIADFFEDRRMGRLLDHVSVDAVADALSELHGDRLRMQQIGSFNHDYAVERFMAPSVANRLVDIYRDVLRGLSADE